MERKQTNKQKTHQMRSVQIFDYAQEFSRGLVYREFQPMGGEMSRRYPTAGYRCWRRGAVFFFSPPSPLHAWYILWSNSVAEQLCGEAVSLRMAGGRLLPRCWWLSGSVRLSRLVQVGR